MKATNWQSKADFRKGVNTVNRIGIGVNSKKIVVSSVVVVVYSYLSLSLFTLFTLFTPLHRSHEISLTILSAACLGASKLEFHVGCPFLP